MNGSSSGMVTPANARRTGKPSPSYPDGAVVSRVTGRYAVAAGSSCGRRGRTRTSSTVIAGISGLSDSVENTPDDFQLVRVEHVDEAVPDSDQVQRSGGDEGGQALVGEHGLLATSVVRTGLLAHQATLDHRVD